MTQTVADLDFELASHPEFGSSRAILERRWLFYRLALAYLPEVSGIAEQIWPSLRSQPSDAFMPLLRDPVIRLTIHEQLRRVAGKPPVKTVDTLPRLLTELATDMGYDWRSLVERDFHPYSLLPGTRVSLWTAESPSTVRLKRLANQFEQECLPNRLVGTTSAGTLIAPSETLCALTNEAVQLLRNLLPHTTQSALEHVSILAWARIYTEDAHVESGTVRTIPGMIFLSPDNLPTPWRLAEAILHEAAHLKLFDLYLTSGILAGTYDALTSVRIKIPWNRPTLLQMNEWPVDQALAALHVYVHLAVLALAGGASPTVGSEAQPLFEKSIFRAHFLAQQLLSMEAQPLGGRGYAFVAWLGKLVDEITSVGYPMTSPESDQDEKVVPFERFVEATPGGGLAWSPQHEIVLLSAQAARLLDKRSRNLPLGEDAPLAERLAPLGIL